MPDGQILPADRMPAAEPLAPPTLTEPPAPLPEKPSPAATDSSRIRRKAQGRPLAPMPGPVAATSKGASELPGFLGPIGYEGAE